MVLPSRSGASAPMLAHHSSLDGGHAWGVRVRTACAVRGSHATWSARVMKGSSHLERPRCTVMPSVAHFGSFGDQCRHRRVVGAGDHADRHAAERGGAAGTADERAEEAGDGALVLPVYVPTLLLSLGQNVVVPTLPIFANQFTSAYALVSLAVVATSLGTMIADGPLGMLLERLGRRRMMLVGCWMIAVASVGTFFVRRNP